MDSLNKSATGVPLKEIVDSVEELEVAFALFSVDDELVFCNKQFRKHHLGIHEMLQPGLHWHVFLREAKRHGSGVGLGRLDAHLSSGSEEPIKVEAVRPGDRYVRMRMQPLKGDAFVITEADITESQIATELQAEAEGLLRRVLDASGALILMSSLNDKRVVYRTRAHRDFMGEFELVTDLYANPEERSDFLAELLSTNRLDGHEVQMIKADGTAFPARLSGRLIEYEGEQVVVTSLMDMTQVYEQREELDRQREASFQNEKLTALGELLAGVAHELNNPLSVVVGQSLMLKEESLASDLARRVDKISASAERCAKIVKTFLAMARQKPTKLEPLDIGQVLETSLDVAAYGLRALGVSIKVDLPHDLPHILADEDQIAQVFVNLIVNAEHALQDKKRDAQIEIQAWTDTSAAMVAIEFRDNGPGIPAHLRARVFEPFFTTKGIGTGTGVGLALCHRIVETHSGKLELLDSDQGAAFRISLPIAVAPKTNAVSHEEAGTNSKLSALVVDDEPDVADMICDLLSSIGIVGQSTPSAEDAITLLRGGSRFDIIFSDLKMPGIGGVGLLDAVQENWPEMASRLVFVTGDGMSPAAEDVQQRRNVPLLEKPVAPHELRHIVTLLMGSQRT